MGFKFNDRRRHFVVNPRMQRRIIFSASWPLVVILGIMVTVQFVLDAQLAAELKIHDLELSGHGMRIFSALVFMAFALVYVGVTSLKLSHRLAGASYRLRLTLEAFRKGDRDVRAKLRTDDFLMDLQDDLNAFLDWTQENTNASAPPSVSRPEPARRTDQAAKKGNPAHPAGTGS